jgi:hypothetical protein
MIRWKLFLAPIAVTSALVFCSPALAQELNCDDFDSQAEAQDSLREDPSDPEGLDGPPGSASTGIRGVACEGNPPPTDFDPVLPSGIGVPNGVPKGAVPKGAVPKGAVPKIEPPEGEPPEGDKELLEAGGDLPLPQQYSTDNASGDNGRFPLWRVVGMILSAGVFVFAGYRVFSRG